MRFERTVIYIAMFTMAMSLSLGVARAVTDQFSVSMLVIGNDVDAPSVPQNVVATAVATTQIDVSWNASSDNVAVDGYQLFRNGTQIATTTLLSYSDVGLTPSTSYDYTVTAFDAALNISAHSATATATTLTPVSTSTPPTQGGNAVVPPDIRLVSFRVVAEEYAVTIRWETSVVTRSTLHWGETGSYELGSLGERAFTTWHETRITGLDPGTRYELLINARGKFDNEVQFRESFMTKALPDFVAPPNPINFTATVAGEDIELSWSNPTVQDFSRVRLIKGKDFYPVDPVDGAPIYEGDSSRTFDRGAAKKSGPHYYALFAYDERGNVSSGALAFLFVPGEGEYVAPPETMVPEIDMALIRFGDLSFIQDGEEVSFIGNEVVINRNLPLTISVPYDRLPEHLKTIVVSITHPEDSSRTFTFLLRVDAEKMAYQATIGALGERGAYAFSLSVFDVKNQTRTRIEGTLRAEGGEHAIVMPEDQGFLGYLARMTVAMEYWFLILLLLLLLTAYYSIDRSRPQWERRHDAYIS